MRNFIHLKKLIVLLFFTLIITSCKDYYNDTIKWMDNLESGLSIENVKEIQPDFVEIDWEKPAIIDQNEKWYMIIDIKGNYDFLNMSHFLVFTDNKFQYRESKK